MNAISPPISMGGRQNLSPADFLSRFGFTEEQIQALRAKVPAEHIAVREGPRSGNSVQPLCYVEPHYITDRGNYIFGEGNWSVELERQDVRYEKVIQKEVPARTPSEKQLKLAESEAKRIREAPSQAVVNDRSALSAWIDEAKSRSNGDASLAEPTVPKPQQGASRMVRKVGLVVEATVKVVVFTPAGREIVRMGNGVMAAEFDEEDANRMGSELDKAFKGATTDAFKRAMVRFGNAFGLHLADPRCSERKLAEKSFMERFKQVRNAEDAKFAPIPRYPTNEQMARFPEYRTKVADREAKLASARGEQGVSQPTQTYTTIASPDTSAGHTAADLSPGPMEEDPSAGPQDPHTDPGPESAGDDSAYGEEHSSAKDDRADETPVTTTATARPAPTPPVNRPATQPTTSAPPRTAAQPAQQAPASTPAATRPAAPTNQSTTTTREAAPTTRPTAEPASVSSLPAGVTRGAPTAAPSKAPDFLHPIAKDVYERFDLGAFKKRYAQFENGKPTVDHVPLSAGEIDRGVAQNWLSSLVRLYAESPNPATAYWTLVVHEKDLQRLHAVPSIGRLNTARMVSKVIENIEALSKVAA